MSKPACAARVSEDPYYIDQHQCSRTAKDGPWARDVYLCWQHMRVFNDYGFVPLWPRGELRNVEGTARRD